MFGETPANENIALSSLTRNPKRDLVKEEILSLLYELETYYEATPSMLAEVLFELLMIQMEPDDPVTSEKAVIWFAQLTRFRDALQSKIDQIENLYDDVQC